MRKELTHCHATRRDLFLNDPLSLFCGGEREGRAKWKFKRKKSRKAHSTSLSSGFELIASRSEYLQRRKTVFMAKHAFLWLIWSKKWVSAENNIGMGEEGTNANSTQESTSITKKKQIALNSVRLVSDLQYFVFFSILSTYCTGYASRPEFERAVEFSLLEVFKIQSSHRVNRRRSPGNRSD